jgi:hypothetical protein
MTGRTTGVIRSHTIFLNNLGMADQIDIPREQDTSRLSPLLNKVTTKDFFQMAGKTPADSEKLKTNVKVTKYVLIIINKEKCHFDALN